MPVPAPRAQTPTNLAFKKRHSHSGVFSQHNSFDYLNSPNGSLSSTREKWNSSLSTWRSNKSRRIWEDENRDRAVGPGFEQGLAIADNASASKGPRAQACIPPMYLNPSPVTDAFTGWPPAKEEPRSWSRRSVSVDETHISYSSAAECLDRDLAASILSPMFGEPSPGGLSDADASSSPLQPLTPEEQSLYRHTSTHYRSNSTDERMGNSRATFQMDAVPEEPVPAPAAVLGTSSSYKKLAEPLANFATDLVWKICTGGLDLPSNLARQLHGPTWKDYPASPPPYLAASVKAVLLSSLLQPSAVFLATWYIARLPVYFGNVHFNGDPAKEILFRVALLGEGQDRENMETTAPFRLLVLGFMLANKWLDDHTFSNKTWHVMSNIPIAGVTSLEVLTLDIFSHNLSISTSEWSQWLSFIQAYHSSVSSPVSVQPISRPSNNPYMVIRRLLEEVVHASTAVEKSGNLPVFLGLEERRKDQMAKDALTNEIMDIDLDEDGPLREEYMPRRRSTGGHASRRVFQEEISRDEFVHKVEKTLPPPAKWSPAGDEPILRERNRTSGHYLPVQPTPAFLSTGYGSATYYRPQEGLFAVSDWDGSYFPIQPNVHCAVQPHHDFAPFSSVNSYPYEQESFQSHHMRSCSMTDMGPRGGLSGQALNTFETQRSWPGQYIIPVSSHPYQPVW